MCQSATKGRGAFVRAVAGMMKSHKTTSWNDDPLPHNFSSVSLNVPRATLLRRCSSRIPVPIGGNQGDDKLGVNEKTYFP